MDFDNFSGVAASSPEAGSSSDASTAVSPTEAANDSGSLSTVESGMSDTTSTPETDATETASAEPAPDAILQEIDPALLSEKASKAFAYLRTTNQDLATFRTEAEPVYQWVSERGGKERIAADVEFVSSIFAEPPDPAVDPQGYDQQRVEVHSAFYQQSPEAYLRFADDIRKDVTTRQFWLEQEGIDDDLLTIARQLRDNPEQREQLAAPQVDDSVLATIPEHLRDTFRSLPPKVQQDLALRDDEVRAFDLQTYHDSRSIKQQQEAAKRTADERAVNEQKQQAVTRQNKVYSDIRTILGQKLTKYFPEDAEQRADLLNSIESAFLSDPKGAALWQQFAGWAEKGEMRRVTDNLLSLVTELEVIAEPKIKRQLALAEKARKWDEHQRSLAPEHAEPQLFGETPRPSNGRVPSPATRGQYDPANVAAYFPRN